MEAVPNFSEGRDVRVVEAIVAAMTRAGADVLDWSLDEDHHRSVVTLVGTPEVVGEAVVAGAAVARDRIDLRSHVGVHPRVGALDVLPFVPLSGLTMDDARALARQVGARLANELGVPVYYYGQASDPPGRRLAELRRGGFETLASGWPEGRTPDVLPAQWRHRGAHPTAGATCVGARKLLLAWNVWLTGVALKDARGIAVEIRERNGGFPGVRALAFPLERAGGVQISMNHEDLDAVSPLEVFGRIESRARELGGEVLRTEVIGLVPDRLVQEAASERLRLDADASSRMLSGRLLGRVLGW